MLHPAQHSVQPGHMFSGVFRPKRILVLVYGVTQSVRCDTFVVTSLAALGALGLYNSREYAAYGVVICCAGRLLL